MGKRSFNVDASITIYGMAQCTEDLQGIPCMQCLEELTSRLVIFCANRNGFSIYKHLKKLSRTTRSQRKERGISISKYCTKKLFLIRTRPSCACAYYPNLDSAGDPSSSLFVRPDGLQIRQVLLLNFPSGVLFVDTFSSIIWRLYLFHIRRSLSLGSGAPLFRDIFKRPFLLQAMVLCSSPFPIFERG
ncbi:hypothetical protein KSP40_PGU011645 [Platanthera guangdongensis]|uniref:Gnk2-homologous domain-containing protein n=1 Tax=Platanthera guangdongensis TaxID=2320717 RepID=A0ABR2M8N5_9ASPA